MSVNTDILDGIIYGRVEPHIYAFTTQTVPNYLKVGDTYRPVQVRLQEWKKKYENLKQEFEHTAKVNDDTYFRDYSIHKYLVKNDFHKIQEDEFADGVYPSNEFFRDATSEDVKEAIDDIQNCFDNKDNRYVFYNTEDHLPLGEMDYERDADWEPRQNQQDVIDRFKIAVDAGRKNLLMYAVMRFGKSFTALCCAKEIDAKLVVVVCGMAAVRDEWKINVQRPKLFEDYHFVTTKTLGSNPNIISEILAKGKRVVVYLTLYDLLGDEVKDRHQDLFNLNQQGNVDLLIIDESHFAARSEETGKVLNELDKRSVKKEIEAYDQDFADLSEPIKLFTPKVKLHLSGTPYRILMDGEFQEEDIIAFVQYNDIIEEQQKWDNDNLDKDEWKNPYYGFPQMVRFAFNLNQSAINRLNELRNDGVDYRLNKLLKTNSLYASGDFKTFEYENEVLDLLKAIDGSKEDENIFSFLNYDRIQEGKMCRHIVMVLPFRASCDAMKELITNNEFTNLGEYEILNLAGFGCPNEYNGTDYAQKFKEDISKLESQGKKTITLTVGKMLTGSTVPEWDTMIFLKDASSPQEYDQAIFRLQSQYVKTIKSEDKKIIEDEGETIESEVGKEIRCNMKPQTLLVDFDPTRMFVMQNRKSLISNVNTSIRGNEELATRLQRDLEISPIILLNKGKLQQVVPINIIDAVRQYSANKSIMDETTDVIVDDGVFDDATLKTLIEKETEFSTSGNVFKTKPNEGEGDDVDIIDNGPQTPDGDLEEQPLQPKEKIEDSELKSLRKKLQTYYFKLLLFAYLSDAEEKTLKDIIDRIENSEDGKRIAKHLQLDVKTIKLIREKIHPMALNELENKISNIDDLGEDVDAEIQNAFRKFSRFSGSEIITPEWVADEMVGALPDDVTANSKFLNIAGKMSEFEYALCKRYGEEVKKNIYTIPTSGLTYECTRKMFRFLGIPIENIFSDFTSYNLIDETKNKDIMERLINLGFDVTLGNPPYQEEDGGAGASSKPLYHKMAKITNEIASHYNVLIIPSRWMAGGKGGELRDFRNHMLQNENIRELHDFWHPEEVFPNTNNRGGVCYYVLDKNFDNRGNLVKVVSYYGGENKYLANRKLKTDGFDIFIRNSQAASIIEKVCSSENNNFIDVHVSSRKPFGFATNFIKTANFKSFMSECKRAIKCYGRANRVGYVEENEILVHKEWVNRWKVYVPESNNIGTELNDDNQNSFVGAPKTVCTETFLVIGADLNLNETTSRNLCMYLRTKFARFMLSLSKISQHGTSKTYKLVPLQDFSKSWTDEELYAKYGLTEDEIAFIESMIKPME